LTSISYRGLHTFTAPLVDPGFYTSDIDFKMMKFAFRSVQRFIPTSAWKGYIIGPVNGLNNTSTNTDADLEEYIRSNTMTVFHPTGMSSMSPVGAKWGVVDPDLRVKGVNGRVADLSILVSTFFPAKLNSFGIDASFLEAGGTSCSSSGASLHCWRKSWRLD